MKKYLLGILVLVVAEIVAIALANYLSKFPFRDDDIREECERIYEVVDSTNFDAGEPVYYSCLYNNATNKVVKVGVKKYSYDYDMKINAEGEDYVLLVYDGHYNVYDKQGKAVFKEDREYHDDYYKEVRVIDKGTIIADYNTGEYFDMNGNAVNTLLTKIDNLKRKNGTLVNFIIFVMLMLIAFFLWYFLFWRRYKRNNMLSTSVKTTNSILILLLSLVTSFIVSIIVIDSLCFDYNVAGNNFSYDVVDAEDKDVYSAKYLLWYNKETNSKELIREGSEKMEIGSFPTEEYVTVTDGSKSNVYGPDGKTVFAEDLENADLSFNDAGDAIFDTKTGDTYDMKGNLVNSFKAKINKQFNNNRTVFEIGTFVVLFLLTVVLWYFLSWKRRKKI